MYKLHACAWLRQIQLPSEETPGGGGGGGGAEGVADPNAPQPIKLTDDTLVDFGDGKPTKWGEGRASRYVDRATYDRGELALTEGRKFLLSEAEKLEKAWQQFDQGRGPQPRQARPEGDELLERLSKAPVVSGAELAQLHKLGYAPLAAAIAKQQTMFQTMEQRLARAEQLGQSYGQDQTNRQFEADITGHLAAVADVKGLNGILKDYASDEQLREFAKDIWLSHDQASWKPQEFRAELTRRLTGLVALVRKMDHDYAEKRKQDRQQRFMAPNRGVATPGGPPKFEFKNGTALAREMFSGRESDA